MKEYSYIVALLSSALFINSSLASAVKVLNLNSPKGIRLFIDMPTEKQSEFAEGLPDKGRAKLFSSIPDKLFERFFRRLPKDQHATAFRYLPENQRVTALFMLGKDLQARMYLSMPVELKAEVLLCLVNLEGESGQVESKFLVQLWPFLGSDLHAFLRPNLPQGLQAQLVEYPMDDQLIEAFRSLSNDQCAQVIPWVEIDWQNKLLKSLSDDRQVEVLKCMLRYQNPSVKFLINLSADLQAKIWPFLSTRNQYSEGQKIRLSLFD
jgi:Mg/Co/Ni transporter MgtE